MKEKLEQFAGGALPGNGGNVEVCQDHLDSSPDAIKIALGRPQADVSRVPGVPGPGKLADSGPSSTSNCMTLSGCIGERE